MWVPLRRDRALAVVHYIGVMTVGIGFVMAVPFVIALVAGEWKPALDYTVGMGVAFAAGLAMMLARGRNPKAGLDHAQALVATAGGWLVVAGVAAVPLALSGNYGSFIDAYFDAMSGLTTSGLTLAQGLDHMALSHNTWRHLTHLIGGQGIVVAALSLAIGVKTGGVSLYEAEGREERIVPNVVHTARFIWIIAGVWVLLGTIALSGVNLYNEMGAARAWLHGFWLTIAAYDTGGFGPQSMNLLYYHSGAVEAVLLVLMLAGTLNFTLHAVIMQGDRRELFRDIEIRTLAINISVLVAIVAVGLAIGGVYDTPVEILRKGVFNIVSANSGTGHQTIYPAQWQNAFGPAGLMAVVAAMAFGGCVGSTAGGIKAMRFGLIFKWIAQRTREALAPRSAVIRETYRHVKTSVVTPRLVSNALFVFVLYSVTYIAGGLAGSLYGHPADLALFESVSATANVGLSTGITAPTMPFGLKTVYIALMWAGRLEFLGVFALFAAIASSFRQSGRRA